MKEKNPNSRSFLREARRRKTEGKGGKVRRMEREREREREITL